MNQTCFRWSLNNNSLCFYKSLEQIPRSTILGECICYTIGIAVFYQPFLKPELKSEFEQDDFVQNSFKDEKSERQEN